RLFTNVEHVRRGLADNSACGICSHNFEYALHAIRDCNAAKVIVAQMYTDGAVKAESSLATAGGVMRDRRGKWILGFNRYLGICSVLEAELWAIFNGLAPLLNLGHDKVLINTDNMEAAWAI
ncbi:hypothetical protein Godav_011306, partial [Gossypium davidsonii]|nr:hypothetical protein [Gossypium davidsonii]